MPEDPQNPQINISTIPVRGGIGALLVIIALIAVMLFALPSLRWPTLIGGAGGVLLAVVIILWRRRNLR